MFTSAVTSVVSYTTKLKMFPNFFQELKKKGKEKEKKKSNLELFKEELKR